MASPSSSAGATTGPSALDTTSDSASLDRDPDPEHSTLATDVDSLSLDQDPDPEDPTLATDLDSVPSDQPTDPEDSTMATQELLLGGIILARDHGQVLKILSLYTAMKPRRTIERHLIFKGKRPKMEAPKSENQPALQPLMNKINGPLYYIQLVRDVTEDTFGDGANDGEGSTQNGVKKDPNNDDEKDAAQTDPDSTDSFSPEFPESSKKTKKETPEWSIEFRDTPIAGGSGLVNQRGTLSTKFWAEDPVAFLDLWGFKYVDEYVQEGHMLHHGNVNIFLFRYHQFEEKDTPYGEAPYLALPAWDKLTLFDRSGNYAIQASLMIADNNPDVVNMGTALLVAFQKDVSSVIKLEPLDRLALDTTVK